MERYLKYLLACALMLVPALVLAQPIDSVAALIMAQQFVQLGDNSKLRSYQAAMRLARAQRSETTAKAFDYYIFNKEDGSGLSSLATTC